MKLNKYLTNTTHLCSSYSQDFKDKRKFRRVALLCTLYVFVCLGEGPIIKRSEFLICACALCTCLFYLYNIKYIWSEKQIMYFDLCKPNKWALLRQLEFWSKDKTYRLCPALCFLHVLVKALVVTWNLHLSELHIYTITHWLENIIKVISLHATNICIIPAYWWFVISIPCNIRGVLFILGIPGIS